MFVCVTKCKGNEKYEYCEEKSTFALTFLLRDGLKRAADCHLNGL